MGRTTLDTAALAHDLRLAVMRLSRRLRTQRVDTTVTLTHLAALSTLRRHGPMSPGELAAHERVQPPSMTRVVVALEGMGLVSRTPHPTDGRQVVIALTDAAETLLADEARAPRGVAHRAAPAAHPRGARRAARGGRADGQAGLRVSAPGTGMFRSLAVRNFRLYASANLVSNTGTWMQRIGQDWLVLQLSHDSGVALGLVNALQFGPSLVLSMYGGVLGDRYPKRRVLQITQSLMGVLALLLGLLVASGRVQLWHVLVLAGALGAVAAIDAPVRQAFVSEMVGPELLANAVSLNSTIFNGARLIGPSVAG